MFTQLEERDLLARLSFKYLNKCLMWEESYSVFDLVYDVISDSEYEMLSEKGCIDISKDDLILMCKEEYYMFFYKPSSWGFEKYEY